MDKEELAPGIVIYNNVINNYESIIDKIESAVLLKTAFWVDASVRSGNNSGVDKNKRDTLTMEIIYSSKLKQNLSSTDNTFYSDLGLIFFNSFDPVEKEYCSSYNINLNWHDSYGILKYRHGSKFVNHIDDHPDYRRTVSTIYYLNDNYSGGEINFPRFNITIKPKSNQMLIFPSTYVYNHSVSPVVDGTRYSVVSWLR